MPHNLFLGAAIVGGNSDNDRKNCNQNDCANRNQNNKKSVVLLFRLRVLRRVGLLIRLLILLSIRLLILLLRICIILVLPIHFFLPEFRIIYLSCSCLSESSASILSCSFFVISYLSVGIIAIAIPIAGGTVSRNHIAAE